VTAMALLGQRDAGLLALDDSVVTHVPYFGLDPAFEPASVRIDHLLLHTSGIGDWETEPFAWVETLASSFAMNANQPLWAPAGAIHNYSNRGYTLAGLVAAEVQGTSFADAVAMHVLEPLGMMDATMDAGEAVSRAHAEGRSGSEWVGPADFLGELYQPSAGLWASADDLGALLVGVLARDEMAELRQPTHASYGQHYGWGVYVESGLDPIVVHHGGSTAGYLADLHVVPARAFGVAVVINTDAYDVGSISYAIREHYAGPFANVDVDLPIVDASLVPGTYVDPWQLGTLQVQQAGGGLSLTFVDLGQTVAMEEPWPGAWFIEDPESGYELGLTFWPDATGAPTHLVTRRGIAARQ
jgi:CubicO group peptidase (beta-lactamase class C family)